MSENELFQNMSCQVMDVLIFAFIVCHSAGLEENSIVKMSDKRLGFECQLCHFTRCVFLVN